MTTQATTVLDTYPADRGRVDKQALANCIEACSTAPTHAPRARTAA